MPFDHQPIYDHIHHVDPLPHCQRSDSRVIALPLRRQGGPGLWPSWIFFDHLEPALAFVCAGCMSGYATTGYDWARRCPGRFRGPRARSHHPPGIAMVVGAGAGSPEQEDDMTVTTPLGQVLRDEEGMRLEFVRIYDETVDEVWLTLTEPDRLARWFGTWTGDPATGTVELLMCEDEDSTPQTVTVLECQPPTRLLVELPSPDGTWRLSVSLRAQASGTTLVFTQRLAQPYDASSIGPGWHYYLDRLGAVVTNTVVPDTWDDYYPSLQDAYALPS